MESQRSKQYAFDSGNFSEAKVEPELWGPETDRSQIAVIDDHGELIISSPKVQE